MKICQAVANSVNFRWFGGWKPISFTLLWEPVDPELILVMRPFDRHAEFAGQTGSGTRVIDMGMGDQ